MTTDTGSGRLLDVASRDTFRHDGVVLLRGLFRDWVALLREGVARNRGEPGPYAKHYRATLSLSVS